MGYTRFFLIALTTFGLTGTGWFLLADGGVPERVIPFTYRQYLLENTVDLPNRVVIESGSNSIHGIDPVTLSRYFRAPVITVAANAGYPLRPKLFNLMQNLHEGDLLILPLEWNQYMAPSVYPGNFLDGLSDGNLRLEYYYNSLPLSEKLRFVFTRYPVAKVLAARSRQHDALTLLQGDMRRLAEFESLLHSGSVLAFGNSSLEEPGALAEDGSTASSCDEYILAAQLDRGFGLSEEFLDNLSLLDRLRDRGIRILFTWPVVTDGPGTTCYGSEPVAAVLADYAGMISSVVAAEGYEMIGQPADSAFGPECFLDTWYHIRRSCARQRTDILVTRLQEAGVAPLDEPLLQSAVITTVESAIREDGERIETELGRLYPRHEVGPGNPLVLTPDELILDSGWSYVEPWGVWSDGAVSRLRIRLDPASLAGHDLVIKLSGHYFNGDQETGVTLAGQRLPDTVLTEATFTVTADAISEFITLELRHRDVVSPRSLGLSRDDRLLKYGLHEVQLSAGEPPASPD